MNTKDLQQSGAICWNTAIRCFNMTAICVVLNRLSLNWGKMMKTKICAEGTGGGSWSSEQQQGCQAHFMPYEKIRVCVIEYVQNPNEAMNNRSARLPAGAPHNPTPDPHYACLGRSQSQAGNRSE